MGYTTLKYSVMEGNESTNQNKSFVGNSPIKFTLTNGQNYAVGPNQTLTLPSNYATEAVAQDARLKVINVS